MSASEKVARLIRDLETHQFWGGLELKFENGRMTYCRKTETINLKTYSDAQGENNHEQHNPAR